MNSREQFIKEKCSKCLFPDCPEKEITSNLKQELSCYSKYLEQDREKLLNQLELKDQQIEKMLEALKDYLEWGAMTSSDRDLFDNRFKELISSITGQSEGK